MRLAAPQADSAPPHRSPPRSPRASAFPLRGGVPSEKSFLTYSTRDSKKIRAQMDAQIERDLRASRTRNLLGGVGAAENSLTPRSSPPRSRSSKALAEEARNMQVMLAHAPPRRFEQLSDVGEAHARAEAAAVKLTSLLASASREELARAVTALSHEQRQLLHELTRFES